MIAHNIRSAHNIGGIFRTADGAGAEKIYLTGYSPVPAKLGAIYQTSAQKMIAKTALGAQDTMPWKYLQSVSILIKELKREGWQVVALEQNPKSVSFDIFQPERKVALIVGNEPKGIDMRLLRQCDTIVEIPMYGSKNSLNVVVALGVVGYTMRVKNTKPIAKSS